MKNQFSMWGTATMVYLLTGCAPSGSDSGSGAKSGAASIAGGSSGYHDMYNSIARTLVTVQDFDIRTEDGQIIHLDTKPMAIDLQLLAGFSQGLNLDLSAVKFPNGAREILVAEIKTHIVSSAPAMLEFADDRKCELSDLPKSLVLYTAQPIALTNATYHVKMSFSALASIQIEDASTTSCPPNSQKRSSSSDQVCQIANFRQLVPSIPLALDDTF